MRVEVKDEVTLAFALDHHVFDCGTICQLIYKLEICGIGLRIERHSHD